MVVRYGCQYEFGDNIPATDLSSYVRTDIISFISLCYRSFEISLRSHVFIL